MAAHHVLCGLAADREALVAGSCFAAAKPVAAVAASIIVSFVIMVKHVYHTFRPATICKSAPL